MQHTCGALESVITLEYKQAYHLSEWGWHVYVNQTEQLGEEKVKVYKSTSQILQPIVATWYRTLRRIALVALLSVLLYIGIRILFTSTSADKKAKYKKMFKDWFTALCLLFVLHYIMVFTVEIIEEINGVIGASTMNEQGEDVLMTTLRNNIKGGSSWAAVSAQVIIYIVVTIYSITFTIQYIRRLVYLAFLTMIAPLITITYPIDKIKDSKAQAFDMWVKDYIFFNLIQVVHLLLYYIFVSTSIDLANDKNWIFAIVCIGFLTQAEKIIKKMFGFEKSKSMGVLGAAATGAIVTTALTQLKNIAGGSKDGKNDDSSGGSDGNGTKPARTKEENPFKGMENLIGSVALTASGSAEQAPGAAERTEATGVPGATNTPSQSASEAFAEQMAAGEGQAEGSAEENAAAASAGGNVPETDDNQEEIEAERIRIANEKIKRLRRLNGIKAVAERYTGPTLRTLVGGAGTVVGGIIGLSAGIAQGDITKAVGGLVGGGAAGRAIGQNAVSGAGRLIDNAVHINRPFIDAMDTFREGAYGREYAEQVKTQRANNAFKRSSQYQILREEYRKLNTSMSDEELDNVFEKNVDQMLDAGISDSKKMARILKMHKKHPLKFSIDNGIKYTKLAEKCPDDILHNTQKFIRFFEDLNIQLTTEEIQELRNNIIEFK